MQTLTPLQLRMDGAVRPKLIKLCLLIFTHAYVRIDQPLPSLSQTVTVGGPRPLTQAWRN